MIAPGVEPRRRWRGPHYELLVCAWRGHALVGADATALRPQDSVFARDRDGVRWHRCLRCDSWLAVPAADPAARQHPPEREEIELPLRGRALRDRIVLRLIAVDRLVHFVVLAVLAVAVFLIAGHQGALRQTFYKVLGDLEGPASASVGHPSGTLGKINELLSLHAGTLHTVGYVLVGYALLEGVEAVGLWGQRRWAEYLTLVATTLLMPLEIYELSRRFSVVKIATLIVNLAVVVYLLLAKRLFGLRGGAGAERAERDADVGWDVLEGSAPLEAIARAAPPGQAPPVATSR